MNLEHTPIVKMHRKTHMYKNKAIDFSKYMQYKKFNSILRYFNGINFI